MTWPGSGSDSKRGSSSTARRKRHSARALLDRAGVATYWASSFGGWRSDDGHCYSTLETWLLVQRGLAALVGPDTETSRAELRMSAGGLDEMARRPRGHPMGIPSVVSMRQTAPRKYLGGKPV